MRVALATSLELRDLYPGDRPLVGALARLGVDGVPWVWTQPLPPDVDAVVVRTIWDYWHHKAQFRRWLRALDESALPVVNPVPVMQWNLDKRYLLELARAGAHLPKTRCLEVGESLHKAMRELGLAKAVVKPTISAAGADTFAIEQGEAGAAQPIVDGLLLEGPVLVQEFCEEVGDGELSLVFFGGHYSHAVRKRARAGEFRVHVEHGGSVENAVPAAELIEQASALVDGLRSLPACRGEVPTYARVDGLVRGDELLLIELELIEPELFFEARTGAVDDFAALVVKRIEDSRG